MQNIPEMLEFVLALVEATVLTALISYHPVSLAARRSQTDYEIPKTLFIYSLIGMVVGFLVMHHGYLIGFVVFGIGGLLRFKSEFESEGHTMRLILATLIGLCVGLDLPVMALILAGSAWAILFFFGARLYYTLELRFDSKKSSKLNVDALSEFFRLHGFTPVSVTKKKYKQTAEFVLSASRGTDRDKLSREMAVLQSSKQHGIDDWHLE